MFCTPSAYACCAPPAPVCHHQAVEAVDVDGHVVASAQTGALREDAVGFGTVRQDVPLVERDGDSLPHLLPAGALREDAVGRVAERDDVAALRDVHHVARAGAADAAGKVLDLENREVVAEAARDAAADALREHRVCAAAKGVHRAGEIDRDGPAIAALPEARPMPTLR